jgi:hypothetical protein
LKNKNKNGTLSQSKVQEGKIKADSNSALKVGTTRLFAQKKESQIQNSV